MTRADFDELVSTLGRKLFKYSFQFLRNQEEAEDAVQEVFIKLWNMGGKMDEYNSIEALAVTMIKNYCIDQLRKRKYIEDEAKINRNLPGASVPSPHEDMENRENRDILNEIIDQLPDVQKNIIKLREIEGYSYKEIAKKTDLNINNLRVLLSRARKMIREEYLKYHDEHRRT